jgi:hypothetical protein
MFNVDCWEFPITRGRARIDATHWNRIRQSRGLLPLPGEELLETLSTRALWQPVLTDSAPAISFTSVSIALGRAQRWLSRARFLTSNWWAH